MTVLSRWSLSRYVHQCMDQADSICKARATNSTALLLVTMVMPQQQQATSYSHKTAMVTTLDTSENRIRKQHAIFAKCCSTWGLRTSAPFIHPNPNSIDCDLQLKRVYPFPSARHIQPIPFNTPSTRPPAVRSIPIAIARDEHLGAVLYP